MLIGHLLKKSEEVSVCHSGHELEARQPSPIIIVITPMIMREVVRIIRPMMLFVRSVGNQKWCVMRKQGERGIKRIKDWREERRPLICRNDPSGACLSWT